MYKFYQNEMTIAEISNFAIEIFKKKSLSNKTIRYIKPKDMYQSSK